jgi:hypothetical protein
MATRVSTQVVAAYITSVLSINSERLGTGITTVASYPGE